MKRTILALAVAILLAPLAVPAQDAAKKAAPKPASAPSQVLLESWNDVGRKLIAMAEDFPEDKYDFKPTPAQRSFAEQLLHAAGSNYYFINSVLNKKLPADDPKRADFKSKAEIVAFVKKAFDDGAAVIKQKGDAGMNDLVDYGGQQTRMSDIAWGIMEHSGEHYGQLVVYYRLAGLVPPESRPKK